MTFTEDVDQFFVEIDRRIETSPDQEFVASLRAVRPLLVLTRYEVGDAAFAIRLREEMDSLGQNQDG